MAETVFEVFEKYQGQVTEIVLGPAPANIVSARVIDGLLAELDRAEGVPHKKLLLIRGSGQHFSYGASVEEHKADQVGEMLPKFHRLIGRLISSDLPTLAQVSGFCLGGGFEVAMACSFLFADENAKFAVPEIQLAVFPPPASILLPLKCGDTRAQQMVLTGQRLPATDLSSMITTIAPAGTLQQTVDSFIEAQILTKSASSLRFAARAAKMTIKDHYQRHIGEVERLYLNELMATHDAVEGIEAFLEKRPAQFTNN